MMMLKKMKTHPTVLVVEDEPLVRLDISLAMSDAGFAVIEVPDADQAIEILESRSRIDVVFTDVELPGSLDGLELARTIGERWPDIAVLVTSGQTDLREGVGSGFIPKPYDTSKVISRARALAA